MVSEHLEVMCIIQKLLLLVGCVIWKVKLYVMHYAQAVGIIVSQSAINLWGKVYWIKTDILEDLLIPENHQGNHILGVRLTPTFHSQNSISGYITKPVQKCIKTASSLVLKQVISKYFKPKILQVKRYLL